MTSLLLNSSSFWPPSQLLHKGFLWWVVCLCCLFFLSFHWLDHVAAVWFRFVTRMYEPDDCIRVSRVKYLCSTTSSTQAILVHLRQNSVHRLMYTGPRIYYCSQLLQQLPPYLAFTFDTHFSCHCTSAVIGCTVRPSHSTFLKNLYQAWGSAKHLFIVWTLVTWGILLYLFQVLCPCVVPNQQSTWDLLYVVEVVETTIPGHIFVAVPLLVLVIWRKEEPVIRRSILITMSLYVNFIVSYDTYWVRSLGYLLRSCKRSHKRLTCIIRSKFVIFILG